MRGLRGCRIVWGLLGLGVIREGREGWEEVVGSGGLYIAWIGLDWVRCLSLIDCVILWMAFAFVDRCMKISILSFMRCDGTSRESA